MRSVYAFGWMMTALMGSAAGAVPVAYSNCAAKIKVNEPADAAPSYFSEDCRTLYVLPPKFGRLKVTQYQPVPQIGPECQALSAAHKKEADLVDQWSQAVNESVEMLKWDLARTDKFSELEKREKALSEELERQQVETTRISNHIGAQAEIALYSGLAENVKSYQKLNPKLNIKAIPVIQWMASTAEQTPEQFRPESRGAVYSLSLEDNGDALNAKLSPGTKAFREGLKARLQLTNTAACAENDPDSLKAFVPVTFTYAFHLKFGDEVKTVYATSAAL